MTGTPPSDIRGARPRLLDLFCGAGGAAMGYHRAGFDVVGVDIVDQPRYPFQFIRADAIEFIHQVISVGPASMQYDAIHASPPCQAYSRALSHMASPQPELIEPVRDLLERSQLPYVIENVIGAPLASAPTLDGRFGVELCGTQFGMRIGWHRLFETSFNVVLPTRLCRCDSIHVINPHNVVGRERMVAEFGPGRGEKPWSEHRDTAWMSSDEAREAIPPAYTEFIGAQLLAHLNAEVAA